MCACAGVQLKDRVFVTIKVKDCRDADVRLFAEGRLSFKGTVGEKNYALELDLFGKIKPDDSTINVQPSAISLTLVRDEVGDHWPRLPKDTAKNNRVGLDHSVYIDQDDEEAPSSIRPRSPPTEWSRAHATRRPREQVRQHPPRMVEPRPRRRLDRARPSPSWRPVRRSRRSSKRTPHRG